MADKNNLILDDELSAVSGGMVVVGEAKVLVTGLNIRSKADKNSSLVGQASISTVYFVFEILQNQGYIWYRIGPNMWIANDGSWVRFTSK